MHRPAPRAVTAAARTAPPGGPGLGAGRVTRAHVAAVRGAARRGPAAVARSRAHLDASVDAQVAAGLLTPAQGGAILARFDAAVPPAAA